MYTKKITAFLFFAILTACNPGCKEKHSRDPEAKLLNDSALKILMRSSKNEDYQKAIELLEKAITIDSTYVGAYHNKISFETLLKQYDKALITAKYLNKLRPENPNFIITTGILYEKNGDTISSANYFEKALMLYNHILDTMNVSNHDYFALQMNKGISFILLHQQEKADSFLKVLYDRQTDEKHREYLTPLLNKTRKNVIDYLLLEQK